LTIVQRSNSIKHMQKFIKLSPKYQLVIPVDARKVMGLNKAGQKFVVDKVSKNKITFVKEPDLEEYFGAYDDAFPKNALQVLRKMRDTEWE